MMFDSRGDDRSVRQTFIFNAFRLVRPLLFNALDVLYHHARIGCSHLG